MVSGGQALLLKLVRKRLSLRGGESPTLPPFFDDVVFCYMFNEGSGEIVHDYGPSKEHLVFPSNPSKKPTWGGPSLGFSPWGNGEYIYTTGDTAIPSGDVTFVLAAGILQNGSPNQILDHGSSILRYHTTASATSATFFVSGGSVVSAAGDWDTFPPPTWYVHTVRLSGTTVDFFKNKALVVSRVGYSSSGGSGARYVGTLSGGGSPYAEMTVAYMILYGRALDDSEKDEVVDFVRAVLMSRGCAGVDMNWEEVTATWENVALNWEEV